jgi:hypothetical protein
MRFIKLFENFDNEYYLEIDNNTPINQFPFLSLDNMVEVSDERLNLINKHCGLKFKKSDFFQEGRGDWSELRYSHNPLNTIVVYPMQDEYYDVYQYKNYKYKHHKNLSDDLLNDYRKNGKQLLKYRCDGLEGLKKLLDDLGFTK